MRSWFGDEDAERRRRSDERRDYGGRDYGNPYRNAYGEDYGRTSRPGREYGGSDYGSSGASFPNYGGGYARSGASGWSGRGAYDRSYGASRRGGREAYGGDYGSYGRESYGGSEDRGFLERAGDEVASWLGDEGAERRRERDRGHAGRGPKSYTRSDDRIREDVNDRLSDDPQVDASDIEVSVSNCEVSLSGAVQSRFDKRHAEDIAERVSGVRHVQNNLRVSSQGSGGANVGTGFSGATSTAQTGTTTESSMARGTSRRRSGT